MKPSNTGKENVTEILMSIPVNKKGFSFLFVEGCDDTRFWGNYKTGRCDILPAGNQENVIETLKFKSLRKDLRRRVAGIVDPDYELIDPTGKLLVDDLLHDDVPDLENMIVSRKTIAAAMFRPGPFDNTDDADKFAEDWLNAALQLSMDYGYFRLVAKQHRNFNLVPNSIESSYGNCINYSTFRLKRHETAELVVERSRNAKVSASELLEAVKAAQCQNESSRLLVRGKDLLNFMLCVCLSVFEKTADDELVRSKLKDWLCIVRDSDQLFRRLQAKYKCEDLKRTKLYGRIGSWEKANCPYKILKS